MQFNLVCHNRLVVNRAVATLLIPLVKMPYLVIGTTLQDRILIAQNLTKLLILIDCQFGLWVPSSIFSRFTTSETTLKSTTSTTELSIELAHQQGEPFLTIRWSSIHCLELSHKTKKIIGLF